MTSLALRILRRLGCRASAGLGPRNRVPLSGENCSHRVLEGVQHRDAGSGTSGNRTAVLALCKTLLGSRRPKVGFSDPMGLPKCFIPIPEQVWVRT